MTRFPTNQSALTSISGRHCDGLRDLHHRLGSLQNLIDYTAEYLSDHGIQDVVIGVSGGIDSAVALAVLVEVQKIQHLNIHAEVITFDVFRDVFDKRFVNILMRDYSTVKWSVYDLSDAFYAMGAAMNAHTRGRHCHGFEKDPEANITYAMRYQALFARAQQVGGITIGTTNADELDYAGWFGKNSDMVTDVQFLWKFPKCVIHMFALALGVHAEIIGRVPVGDLIDDSSDEQNFGCTYDELRWYTDEGRFHKASPGEHTLFMLQKFDKLEDLRRKNAHKYDTKGKTHFNPVFL